MKNLKFGLQLLILSMAFPVWFVVEMKRADEISERPEPVNIEKTAAGKSITRQEPKEQGNTEFKPLLYFKFLVNPDL